MLIKIPKVECKICVCCQQIMSVKYVCRNTPAESVVQSNAKIKIFKTGK